MLLVLSFCSRTSGDSASLHFVAFGNMYITGQLALLVPWELNVLHPV
ncbi:hypothetical protein ES288_A05G300100v1 [Gossypium darwinii]|uniref:Uncharacterized protein n=2 Tax=Gossypium TaxID=3633 RepID=A0A5D2QLI6_GOSTO|nr:hypothetical protein ES288_A05G300100v1 [Gossypium darwinii]TYI29259.1 hypothetical protein ES332_A05G304000v1 [Gossypium tomentosum]